ncbi:MAG TPA: 50S ribosomal protein L6 [Armatimonadetes bacterium]|nr:50S ribosomal protein L6 [Armatimonadota bacterium]MCA1996657.1 50S ribosomal protein L6 [Armatimonadota bacterium]HCD99462.1 50S ribosomal protein L6 [Armatimonadota bacterium]
MSRIGQKPIQLPAGVSVTVGEGNLVTVKGPKGELSVQVSPKLTVSVDGNVVTVARPDNDRVNRSQHGLARTLIANCVQGVSAGHSKSLDIIGVGYRATVEGNALVLNMGYSHPVRIDPVPGISFEVRSEDRNRLQRVVVSGIDKALVGQVAADIRKVRKPEPYKGKGIRYTGEVVRQKAGKRAAKK